MLWGSARPLSPSISIYKGQLNSLESIGHRFLAAINIVVSLLVLVFSSLMDNFFLCDNLLDYNFILEYLVGILFLLSLFQLVFFFHKTSLRYKYL